MEDKADVEDVVGQKQKQKQEKWKSVFFELTERSFDVHELLYALFVNYHICNILIFVLFCYIQRQLAIVCSYCSITSLQQQLLHYPSIPRHYSQVQGCHSKCKLLFIDLSTPWDKCVGSVLHATIASPMKRCTSFRIDYSNFEALI